MRTGTILPGTAAAACVAAWFIPVAAGQGPAGPQAAEGPGARGVRDDHAGYYAIWQEARRPSGDISDEVRLARFEEAEAELNRRDRRAPAWMSIDVPNLAQLLAEKETVLSRLGRQGAAFVAAQKAEAAIRMYWGRDPTEDDLRATPSMPMIVYLNVLLDRGEHLWMRGDLAGSWAVYEECRRIVQAHIPEDRHGPYLRRILLNHAVALQWGGRNEASERLQEEAGRYAPDAEIEVLEQIGRLRALCRKGAPSEELCAQLLEGAGRLYDAGRIDEALMVRRRVASSFHDLGRKEEAFRLLGEVLSEAVERRLRVAAADAHLWRGKARTSDGAPGAEEDLFAALDFYRQSGIRPAELRAYAAYARFLDYTGRLPEALAALRSAVDLARATGAVWLEPELLALEARVVLRLGNADESERIWTGVFALLDRLPDLDEARRLGVFVERLRQLRAREETTELAATLGRAQAFAERSNLSEYEKAPLRDFIGRKDPEALTAGAAPAFAPDFQPAYISTRVRAGAAATAWAWLVNPSTVPLDGRLRAAAAAGVEWGTGPDGVRELKAGGGAAGRGTESAIPVRVPAGGVLPVRLSRGATADPAAASATLEWIGKERLAVRWDVAGGADAAMFTESVQHSLVAGNPFFSLPLYHEVRPVKAAGAVNLRVRASQPCRLEVRDAADRRLLGVDADGDGGFGGVGDLLGGDADVDGYPDLPPGGAAVVVHVFALPGKAVQGPLDVIVEIAADGAWRPVGMDRILNGAKPDRPK